MKCLEFTLLTDLLAKIFSLIILNLHCDLLDIDECARRIDTCTSSERCENTEGSYVCRRLTGCGTGYTLNEETQECVGMYVLIVCCIYDIASIVKELTPVCHLRGVKTQRGHMSMTDWLWDRISRKHLRT